MNQANIDSLTERIKIGDLVQLLYQSGPVFGLVVDITKGTEQKIRGKKKRTMTFVTLTTSTGMKKYPIFWCEPVE